MTSSTAELGASRSGGLFVIPTLPGVLTCCACGGCYIPGRTFEATVKETSCEGYCLGGWLTCCLQPCYYGALRREMRNKYKIKVCATALGLLCYSHTLCFSLVLYS